MRDALALSSFGSMSRAAAGDVTPTADGIRWGRVLAVAIGFWLVFYTIDHDAAAFAGMQVTDETEGDIADEYIDEIEGGSALRKFVVIGYGFCGLLGLAYCDNRPWNLQSTAAACFCLLLAWTLSSVLWSAEPALTFKRLVAAGMIVVGSLGFARMLNPNELLAVALLTFSAFVSYSLMLDVGHGGKPWDPDYRFGGTLHPNIQAAYCGMLCLAAFCLPTRWGGAWVMRCLMVFGFVLLLQTQSRTSALAVIVGVLITLLVRLAPRARWGAAWGLIAMASLATIVLATLGNGDRRALTEAALLGRTDQAGSLTGRVPLWQELVGFAAKRPLHGYGYESFWTADNIDAVMKSQKWALQSAHNAYFEVVLQLGLVGLALAMATLLLSFNLMQAAYERTHIAGYAFAYGVLGFAIANSLLESHFAKLKYPTVIALIAVLGVIAFHPTEAETLDDESLGGGQAATDRRRVAAPHRAKGGRRVA
ncbi:O-Antigen ligase [Botrimarina colliarenosi]|uniref:O-Antigen ligase n=1 Tax=Botrimarina colliarenosi TaxID=2528001 RepID=A0A5C6A8Y9_9BACT|nr:O-antigen ligase family protein [Botrimarina colliarenosi]TWT95840.1 O-Antigen ligase [Botrimarina colliarenosi]